jgi:ATP-binding cassette, subfamily G (WHITE), eye pigment precursor transporter
MHAHIAIAGLDSYMAEIVVAKMKELANSGCTIITTIHQPSSSVFEYFTHLHLLGEGRTAYCGTTAGALEHFASVGYPCPAFYNPADQ